MAGYRWNNTPVIGIPTSQPRFAKSFMEDTGLKAPISNDLEPLKKLFPFVDAPFAVAIENGRQKASFPYFEGNEPADSLKKLGFID